MGRVGVGDMKKRVYDPDNDGILALAQLDSAVCSETEADDKIAAYAQKALTTEEGSGSKSVASGGTTEAITFANSYRIAVVGVGRCHAGGNFGSAQGVGFRSWTLSNGDIIGMTIGLDNEGSGSTTVYWAWTLAGEEA